MPLSDQQKLDELNRAIAGGLTSYSADGHSGTFDRRGMLREKHRLEVKLGLRRKRKRFIGFDLTGGR